MVEDWARILHVRSLVMTPQEDVRTWLKFASLCRKSELVRKRERDGGGMGEREKARKS